MNINDNNNFAAPPKKFREAIKACLDKYGDFASRASRSEYWWFQFFQAVVVYPGSLLLGNLSGFIMEGLSGIISIGIGLYFLIPTLAAGARRLHDTNHSGLWLLALFIPIIQFVTLFFLVQKGKPEKNEYNEQE